MENKPTQEQKEFKNHEVLSAGMVGGTIIMSIAAAGIMKLSSSRRQEYLEEIAYSTSNPETLAVVNQALSFSHEQEEVAANSLAGAVILAGTVAIVCRAAMAKRGH